LAPRKRIGTSKALSRQPKYEPSGAKDIQREQGIVHSQSRAYQNDSKYPKINRIYQFFYEKSMTNALTATKTPQLSSQGVPDVILVLNKQEKIRNK
jgi:hypothetical protein